MEKQKSISRTRIFLNSPKEIYGYSKLSKEKQQQAAVVVKKKEEERTK